MRLSRRNFLETALAGASVWAMARAAQAVETNAPPVPAPVKTPMKIFIMTDLEGVAMVSRFDQTRDEATPESKAQAMKLLTAEVNAAVDGILDAAPEAEVIVIDGHGNGGINIMEFHPKAKLIPRSPNTLPCYPDSTFTAMFFVGQHAMAGTKAAPLAHTYSSKTIEYYKLNGRMVGEFGARAYVAGSFGVPVVFISGDDKAVAEAKTFVPDIFGAVVKQGLDLELAIHLSPEAARELIRKTASEAVRNLHLIQPIKLEPPYELEIRVKEGKSIEHYLRSGATKIDERTVVFKSGNLCELNI